MRAAPLCLGVLLSAGCQSDVFIAGDLGLQGAGDAPSLTTPVIVDKLVQTPIAASDILFVIDNSPTMDDDQANLFRNLPVMMDFFAQSDLDFHVGVTSTNKLRNGKLFSSGGEMWLTPQSPDAVGAFVDMASQIPRSPGAAQNEAGIATTYMALQLNTENAGFLRPGAGLTVVVMSDEDDQSFGQPIARNEFISWMNSFPQDPDTVTFSSFVCQRGDPCLVDGGTVGDNYMAVSNAVGGVVWPINDNDYTDALQQLAIQAAGLHHEFFLTQLPVPGTLEVWANDGERRDGIDAADIPAGGSAQDVCARLPDCVNPFTYTYSGTRNSVVFDDYIPQPFAKITLSYESLADQERVDETETP